MENMTLQSQRETLLVKVVTLATFIFLPATFVSVSVIDMQRIMNANSPLRHSSAQML